MSQIAPHRGKVGHPVRFDVLGAMQFSLLVYKLGMRDFHYLLDVGCGCLRGGRFSIVYLNEGHYYGTEPDAELLEAGQREEVGMEMIGRRKPVFSNDADFNLSSFGRKFDYIMAQSVLSHTPPEKTKKCLREAASVMHPASVFAATYFEAEVSESPSSWMEEGVKYRTEDIFSWAREAGLRAKPIDWYQPSQKWLLFTLL